MVHEIPKQNWHIALSETIGKATPGDTVVCHTPAMIELAKRAAARMRPQDHLEFVLEDSSSPEFPQTK